MNGKRRTLTCGVIAGVGIALACGQAGMDGGGTAAAGADGAAPMFEVDPFWPKPLPEHWLLGSTMTREDARHSVTRYGRRHIRRGEEP